MEDTRTDRQRELETLRNRQSEDLALLREAVSIPRLVDASSEGLPTSEAAELALRRQASKRRAAIGSTLAALFAYSDAQAPLKIVQNIHGASGQQFISALEAEFQREAQGSDGPAKPSLEPNQLGPYVVLIEAADMVRNAQQST